MSPKKSPFFIFISLALIGCGVVVYFIIPTISSFFLNDIKYNIDQNLPQNKIGLLNGVPISSKTESTIPEQNIVASNIPVTHIKTPEKVKAIYLSGWVAGSVDFRNSLIKMVDNTELNAVVIDIKDSTGRVSFATEDPVIQKIGSSENRIKNIKSLTALLHSKGIYIIGRISTFQDPYLTKLKPEWAIKKISNGEVWKDRKGLSFLDPTNKNVHNYVLSLALDSYKEGFDEINFDYIRYPSDGNMKDINYNLSAGKTRADNIEAFFKFISTEIKKVDNVPISGDLFGLTTETNDDMGIGQVWEKAIPYFDFLCPMVYPSHYPAGYGGYKNPAQYPYEVINKALVSAVVKTKSVNQSISKIRPWLQDFDLGAVYTKDLIRAEMKAVYDNGLSSWMLWDPSNKYTPQALLLETIN